MKLELILLILILCGLSMVSSSCSQKSATADSGPDVTVRIPWFDTESRNYSMQNVTLTGLTSMSELSGKYARFFFSPGIKDQRLTGLAAKTSYFRNGHGVYVPKDITSLHVAMVYAVIERLAALDQQVGAGGVNQFPRDIGISVQAVENGRAIHNNAFYDGVTDSILILRSSSPDLPINANAGIIAHEYFHSLFYKLVVKKLREEKNISLNLGNGPHAYRRSEFFASPVAGLKSDLVLNADQVPTSEASDGNDSKPKKVDEKKKLELRNRYIDVYSRGINEGMADYWAWLFTNDPDFLALSLPREKNHRSLVLETSENLKAMHSQSSLFATIQGYSDHSVDPDQDLVALSYEIGTSVARFLKSYASLAAETQGLTEGEAKLRLARSVILALSQFRGHVAGLKNFELPSPRFLLQTLFTTMSAQSSQKECEFILEYMKAVKETTDKDLQCQKNEDPAGSSFKIVETQTVAGPSAPSSAVIK